MGETMTALDAFGQPAYDCAVDGSGLVPLPDDPTVLHCPACGHRTDEPGTGVLGDAFDVRHRQWGLRGDVHVWNGLRDLLATTPTPQTAEATRSAFVAGIRRVADVDIDAVEDEHVYREHLDHGGMSGGTIDVVWWRTKGCPLLLDRAMSRRPAPPTSNRRSAAVRRPSRGLLGSVVIWAVLLGIPAALLGGGGWLMYQRAVGTRVEAAVLSCDASGNFRRYGSTFRTECVAEWTIDGETVIGNFEGGNGASDVGTTVDATVRGDTAYSRSLILPVVLIALGLPFLVVPLMAVRSRGTQRAAAR